MKTPGEYALMWANGMPWADVVNGIRKEILDDCEPGCYHSVRAAIYGLDEECPDGEHDWKEDE